MTSLRIVLRQLFRSPGYTTAAVLTLALAIGTNTSVFAVVRGVLLHPLPFDKAEELAVVWQTDKETGQSVVELTHRHLREWNSVGQTFTQSSLIGSHNWSTVLEGYGEPTKIWFAGVSASFFDTLGVAPLHGRAFRPEDDVPNGAPVAVLNHGAWIRRFGGDPSIVGKSVQLDGQSVQVIGVMRPGVDLPRGAEFWVPVVPVLAGGDPPNLTGLDSAGVLYVLGRLRSGLSPEAARPEIDSLEARLDQSTPGRLKWGDRAVVTPLVDHLFGPVRPALWLSWAAVAVLLLIACANVSGLVLTRLALRRREHGVRLALGATPGAVSSTWVLELVAIAIAGGALGALSAGYLTHAIVALAPDDIPEFGNVTVDWTLLAFSLGITLVAALVATVVPIRHAARTSLVDALTDGSRSTASRRSLRLRSSLVTVQIALSVVLLVAAGLIIRSVIKLHQLNLGFSPDNVLSLVVQPRSGNTPPNVWLDQLLAGIRGVPGVESAGGVYLRPLALGPIGQGVLVGLEGQPATREAFEKNPTLNHQIATPGYFEAMKTRLVRGRFFDSRDNSTVARVAIVSESTARRLWPGQDPINKQIRMSQFTPGAQGPAWRTVVGVVSDVRYRGLNDVQLDIYDPALQVGRPANNLVIRTTGEPAAVVDLVRAQIRRMDPTAVVDGVTTMDAIVDRAVAPWRMTMWVFVAFAGLAFALASVGLFGLVALDVAERRQEFAVRLALGSSAARLVRDVMSQLSWRVVIGAGAGLLVAGLGTRLMANILFEVAPLDPVTYAGVIALVVAVVAVASYIPARRATEVQPQELLRR